MSNVVIFLFPDSVKLKEVDGIARTVRELMHVLSNSIETGPVVVYLRHMEGWRDALHAVVGEMKVSNRTPPAPPRPSKTKKKMLQKCTAMDKFKL